MKQQCSIEAKKRKMQTGFSMVELAVVLSIIAVIIGGALMLSTKYAQTSKINKTIAQLQRINASLQVFAIKNGYLPCPARRSTTNPAEIGVPTNCATSASAQDVVDINMGAEAIRIGVVPTRFLGLPDRVMLDSWENRILYVTIRNLGSDAQPIDMTLHEDKIKNYIEDASFPAQSPIIVGYEASGINGVLDDNSNDVIAYLLISLGKDRYGAYGKNGEQNVSCLTGRSDADNCDYDEIFRAVKPNFTSNEALYADDIVIWQSLAHIYKENLN